MMLGIAMFTIVVSSRIMKKPRQSTSRASQGLRPPIMAALASSFSWRDWSIGLLMSMFQHDAARRPFQLARLESGPRAQADNAAGGPDPDGRDGFLRTARCGSRRARAGCA